MQTSVLRHLLTRDWAAIANTPAEERQPSRLRLWYDGARELASREGRVVEPVVAELQARAAAVAEQQRLETLADLARDLAVHHALGETPGCTWRRRLRRLGRVMGLPDAAIVSQVEERAASVEVVFHA